MLRDLLPCPAGAPRSGEEEELMPDISMCRDNKCPSHLSCYRFMARPNEPQQCYAEFQRKGERCEDFMKIIFNRTKQVSNECHNGVSDT